MLTVDSSLHERVLKNLSTEVPLPIRGLTGPLVAFTPTIKLWVCLRQELVE